MQIIHTDGAPSHTGPVPQAVEAGGWIHVSALFGANPLHHAIPEDARAEAEQIFDNLEAILAAGAAPLEACTCMARQSSARRASTRRSRRAHHHQQRLQEGTTTMTDHDDQTPTRADFRRAAALYLHRRHHDHAGVNTILADADNRQRCSALVLAAIDLAFQSPYALASPAGIAGLQRVAVHMAQDDDDEHHRR